MKINHSLELDENRLREIRASFGRGGRATRAEVRIWLNRIVTAAISDLPPAKVRACNTSRRKPSEEGVSLRYEKDGTPVILTGPPAPDAICARCRRPWLEHRLGRRAYCPLSKGVRPGSSFELKGDA